MKGRQNNMITNETYAQTTNPAVSLELPRRYEIWTASFPEGSVIRRCRPVVIVGTNEDCGQVTVIPMTSKLCYKQKKTHVLVEGQGLNETGRALGELVTTLPNCCLSHRIGYLSDPFDRMALRHALAIHLGLSETENYGCLC